VLFGTEINIRQVAFSSPLLFLLLLLLLTAIELSLGGSSPYTSTDKTYKNKCTQTKQYKKHSTNNYVKSLYIIIIIIIIIIKTTIFFTKIVCHVLEFLFTIFTHIARGTSQQKKN